MTIITGDDFSRVLLLRFEDLVPTTAQPGELFLDQIVSHLQYQAARSSLATNLIGSGTYARPIPPLA